MLHLNSNVVGYLLDNPFEGLPVDLSREVMKKGRPSLRWTSQRLIKTIEQKNLNLESLNQTITWNIFGCVVAQSGTSFFASLAYFFLSLNAYGLILNSTSWIMYARTLKGTRSQPITKWNWKAWKRYGQQQRIDVALSLARAEELDQKMRS